MISSLGDRESLATKTRELFKFLEQKGSSVEVDDRTDGTVIAYVLEPLSFEVELDWREGAAFLLVARTEKGHRPGGYYMHNRQRVRVHLTDALERINLSTSDGESHVKTLMRDAGKEAMVTQLSALASLLRSHLDALTAKSNLIFD